MIHGDRGLLDAVEMPAGTDTGVGSFCSGASRPSQSHKFALVSSNDLLINCFGALPGDLITSPGHDGIADGKKADDVVGNRRRNRFPCLSALYGCSDDTDSRNTLFMLHFQCVDEDAGMIGLVNDRLFTLSHPTGCCLDQPSRFETNLTRDRY